MYPKSNPTNFKHNRSNSNKMEKVEIKKLNCFIF